LAWDNIWALAVLQSGKFLLSAKVSFGNCIIVIQTYRRLLLKYRFINWL